MWFRVFTSALVAGVSYALGALVVWLIGEIKLSPELQAHHPFAAPVSDLFRQTQGLFLGALAAVGALAGFLLPARRYGARKIAELEATARTFALVWGFIAGMIGLTTALESVTLWPFIVLSVMAGGAWLFTAALLRARRRAAARRAAAEPMVSDAAPSPATPAYASAAGGSPVDRLVDLLRRLDA